MAPTCRQEVVDPSPGAPISENARPALGFWCLGGRQGSNEVPFPSCERERITPYVLPLASLPNCSARTVRFREFEGCGGARTVGLVAGPAFFKFVQLLLVFFRLALDQFDPPFACLPFGEPLLLFSSPPFDF
jgi:hypothetical protein